MCMLLYTVYGNQSLLIMGEMLKVSSVFLANEFCWIHVSFGIAIIISFKPFMFWSISSFQLRLLGHMMSF